MDRTILITRCSSGSDLLGEWRGSVGNLDCAVFARNPLHLQYQRSIWRGDRSELLAPKRSRPTG
jgi:hypothetical protein